MKTNISKGAPVKNKHSYRAFLNTYSATNGHVPNDSLP